MTESASRSLYLKLQLIPIKNVERQMNRFLQVKSNLVKFEKEEYTYQNGLDHISDCLVFAIPRPGLGRHSHVANIND